MRELQPIHFLGLAFQVLVIASAAFIFWLWLMTIYPASAVASFSFLGPVFGVFFGWPLLGETIAPSILGALALVAVGIWLINRPVGPGPVPEAARRGLRAAPHVPQKVCRTTSSAAGGRRRSASSGRSSQGRASTSTSLPKGA